MNTEQFQFSLPSFLGGMAFAASFQLVKLLHQRATQRNKLLNDNAEHDPEIHEELLSRVRTFFGPKNFNELTNSFVVVVGLGGVGSHAANMLARSGVQRIRLIDFDQVTLSSLNRHSLANLQDVGIPKTEAMQRHLKQIVPWCEVQSIPEMFRAAEADRLLEGAPDYVLDCIDDVNTKAELITYCISRGINIITSMGAGGKADPTKLRIGALSDCIKDPLAAKIKWKLKKHGISPDDVTTIYSVEKPVVELLPLSDEQASAPQDFGAVDYIRLRVMPVLGTSPAIFGQAMSSYILSSLGGKKYEPESCERISKHVRNKFKQVLMHNETKAYGSSDLVDLDADDIDFVAVQVWQGKCAVTGKRIGGHGLLVLARWDPELPPVPYNLVLLQHSFTKPERGYDIRKRLDAVTVKRITARLAWAKTVCDDTWEHVQYASVETSCSLSNENTSCTLAGWSRHPIARAPVVVLCAMVGMIGSKIIGISS